MSRYTFVNGWLSTLAAPITSGDTTLTPATTVDAPLLDPTATTPLIAALIVDCDPATGLPTATSEIMTVTDTRTSPWTVVPADESVSFGVAQGAPVNHASGVPIAFVASAAALDALVNPDINNADGTTNMGSRNDGDVLTSVVGLWQPQAPAVPALLQGLSRNATGTTDAQSVIPSGYLAGGNFVPVTDGSGNTLEVLVPANTGRDVELTASVPMVRDGNTDANLFVSLLIYETTLASDLATAALHAVNFRSTWIPVPTVASGNFQALQKDCWLTAAELTIDRKWAVSYTLINPNLSAPAGRWVRAVNAADAYGVQVTNKALTANVATLTTFVPHAFLTGDSVTVAAVGSPFDGTYTVASVPSTTTFTYAKTASNVTSVVTGGIVTPASPNPSAPVVRTGSRLAAVLH